ncbi:3TM-type holin [Massilia sp. CFBP9012]|uniref:3TM-type holin n=1 Tax=Massilia sp. CFBP9012 TaxID=3096531 RepID=UPI002A69F30A|nr:3TM-type holin [Massilia sp. CFBP9012]MDY0974984.1 3TM-type holin [Massilia sp. CFBP9012]
MAPVLTALLPMLGNVFDRLFPDPAAAADAKVKVMEMAQRGELAQLDADLKMATGQMEVNKAEAQHQSIFVAGWRPAIGWVCAAAFAFKFVVGPTAAVLMAVAGHPITLPEFDFSEMSTILLGMLGLGTLRTVEKIKKVP